MVLTGYCSCFGFNKKVDTNSNRFIRWRFGERNGFRSRSAKWSLQNTERHHNHQPIPLLKVPTSFYLSLSVIMAALLCQSIGQLLSNCTLPCRSCCDGVSKVLCSPFFPYIALTVGLNLPPVLWGAKAITTDCDSSWLLVNALATGLNVSCLALPQRFLW